MGRGAGQAVTFEDLQWYADEGIFEAKSTLVETDRRLCKKSEVEARLYIQPLIGEAGRAVKSEELKAQIFCGTFVDVMYPTGEDIMFYTEMYDPDDEQFILLTKEMYITIQGSSGTVNISSYMDNGVGYHIYRRITVVDEYDVELYNSGWKLTQNSDTSDSGTFSWDDISNGFNLKVKLWTRVYWNQAPSLGTYTSQTWGTFTLECPVDVITEYWVVVIFDNTVVWYELQDQNGNLVYDGLPVDIDFDVTVEATGYSGNKTNPFYITIPAGGYTDTVTYNNMSPWSSGDNFIAVYTGNIQPSSYNTIPIYLGG